MKCWSCEEEAKGTCALYGDVFILSADITTEMDALAQFVPKDFEILEPVVNVQYMDCRGVEWFILRYLFRLTTHHNRIKVISPLSLFGLLSVLTQASMLIRLRRASHGAVAGFVLNKCSQSH